MPKRTHTTTTDVTLIRRLSYVALVVLLLHVVFGAIVRITGSGMGCGDHWPKCYGQWFPPLTQPDLVIEWTHRLLAAILGFAVLALVAVAWNRRAEYGVGGRGGVLRMASLSLAGVVVAALFGGITVKLENIPSATVVHWGIAAATLAAMVVTVIRTGGLGGASARSQTASPRAWRGLAVAVGIALVTVLMGGLTAKVPGASVGCLGFPLCNGAVPASMEGHIQLTHRIIAYLLTLHIVGLTIGFTRRREAPVVRRGVYIAMALVVMQIVIAAGMVLMLLPAELRSLHQATGVAIWVTLAATAYLARVASGRAAFPARRADADVDAIPAHAVAGGATS